MYTMNELTFVYTSSSGPFMQCMGACVRDREEENKEKEREREREREELPLSAVTNYASYLPSYLPSYPVTRLPACSPACLVKNQSCIHLYKSISDCPTIPDLAVPFHARPCYSMQCHIISCHNVASHCVALHFAQSSAPAKCL